MADGPVVVLGAGSAGEHFVGALRRLDADVEIVVVERELAGGECSYYACLPTKTLLRPVEVLAAARLAPGAAEAVMGEVDVERVLWWRDQVTDGRDDSYHANWLAEQNAELVRGDARVVGPGAVAVGQRRIEFGTLVVATGSSPAIPSLPGIEDVDVWTSRDAVWASAPPKSLVILGGGPVGVELSQFFHRLGAEVTIVEPSETLLARVDPDGGTLLRERLEEEGVEVRVGARADAVEARSGGVRVYLDSGGELDAERLLVATGRRPNVAELGLEELGLELTERGVSVDERLRAADGVYAIGDVAGVALLTHVGKYQARVAAANIAGRETVADYRAIPSAVFTDPQVASVGRTAARCRDGELRVAGGQALDLRAAAPERPRQARRRPRATRARRRVAVGPEAGEWLGQLTLAVRAQVPMTSSSTRSSPTRRSPRRSSTRSSRSTTSFAGRGNRQQPCTSVDGGALARFRAVEKPGSDEIIGRGDELAAMDRLLSGPRQGRGARPRGRAGNREDGALGGGRAVGGGAWLSRARRRAGEVGGAAVARRLRRPLLGGPGGGSSRASRPAAASARRRAAPGRSGGARPPISARSPSRRWASFGARRRRRRCCSPSTTRSGWTRARRRSSRSWRDGWTAGASGLLLTRRAGAAGQSLDLERLCPGGRWSAATSGRSRWPRSTGCSSRGSVARSRA